MKGIDPGFLNKWTAEDITEEPDQDPLFTVTYFIKSETGYSAFYFMEFEEPPIVGFTKKIVEDAESDLIILTRSDRWHPLNHVSQSALNHGMMKSIFEGDTEAV